MIQSLISAQCATTILIMIPTANRYDNAEPPQYLVELARFACHTRYEDLPVAALARCKIVLADCVAVVAAGMQSREMQSLVASYASGTRSGSSALIGARRALAAVDAGFLNGIAATWHDFDEGNTAAHGHPGTYVVPAALAAAQELGASGKDMLAAAVVGYEVCARVGAATRMRVAVHPHGTYGVIGAAVAAARLKGFDVGRMCTVINIAAAMAMATNRQAMLDEATMRNVYTGHTALAGHIAVQLTEAGFTGQRDGISFTFGAVIADGFDAERAIAGLGTQWLINQGYFKLHPAGRYAHAAIDALEDALKQARNVSVAFGDIDKIEVKAFKLASLLSGTHISTSFGAKFSIPFALATILYHGRSSLECFDERAVADPQIQALMKRVEVTEEPRYTELYPNQHRCDVTLVLKDGTNLVGHCEIMKGDPANPHQPEEVRQKYFDLTVPVWGEVRARRIYEICMRLDEEGALEELGAELVL
jgi:2-methylcitrate dehydratase PrpD